MFGAREVIAQGFYSPLIWLVGPDYAQTKREFEYLVKDALAFGLIENKRRDIGMPSKGSCHLTLNILGSRCEILTKSAKDPDTLGSYAPNMILACEAAQMSGATYINLTGRIGSARGRLILSGTFEEASMWYQALYEDWKDSEEEGGGRAYSLPSWANLSVYPGGREDPEIKRFERIYTKETFRWRIAGEPAKLTTLIFPEFEETLHVREFEFNPDVAVRLAVDWGYAHPYSVLAIQEYDDAVWVYDEIYEVGKTSEEIIAMTMAKPWWAQVVGGVEDVSALQHDSKESHHETWLRLTGLNLRSKKIPILDGIERHHTFLINPSTNRPRLFHHPRCKGIIDEYAHYKRRRLKDEASGQEKPIDRYNDSLKALAYYLIDTHGYVDVLRKISEPLFYNKPNPWKRMGGRK